MEILKIHIMTIRFIVVICFTLLFFTSCSQINKAPASRVVEFNYGGYGDTNVATLSGQVFYIDASKQTADSIIPLHGVTIKVMENNHLFTTDSIGKFEVTFYRGIYSLLLSKEGYQPLLVKNYISDPDQFSRVKIYMEKGITQQLYFIPAEEKK